MPADDDWILYAGYNDKTLMRNVIAYDTARRMGRYASRTRFVEVRLNGRYHGVYVLMEKLKLNEDRIDLPEPAQLLEWTFGFQAKSKGRYVRLPISKYFMLYEDPEREDIGHARRAQVQRSIGKAERALYGADFRDPERGWRRHIDEAAAIDFVLVNELFKNQDAFHGGLRGDILRGVRRRASRLSATGAVRRNFARWPVLGTRIWPNPPAAVRRTTYASEVSALRSWLKRRIAWLDANVDELQSGRT